MTAKKHMIVPTSCPAEPGRIGAAKVTVLGSFTIAFDGRTSWEFMVNTSTAIPLMGLQITEAHTRMRVGVLLDEDGEQMIWDGTDREIQEILARAKKQTWEAIQVHGVAAFIRGVDLGQKKLEGVDLDALYLVG